jgi:hypothetical protein
MFAKFVAALYLISLYFFLGVFLKREEYRIKLLILTLVLLLPTFLIQATRPKSDLILGAFVTLMLLFLLKNKRNNICQDDLLVGFYYSIAVLFKLTSLTLLLLIALYYFINFKHKAVPKLFVVLLCSSALPLLLYMVFGYDLILNIITGRVMQPVGTYASDVESVMDYIVRWILYGQYTFGIPMALLLITHMFKVRQYLARDEVLSSYLFITIFCMMYIFLWGSDMPRHLAGYLPLTIPLLFYIYDNCYEKNKMLLSVNIFLVVSNLLILMNTYLRLNTIRGLFIAG